MVSLPASAESRVRLSAFVPPRWDDGGYAPSKSGSFGKGELDYYRTYALAALGAGAARPLKRLWPISSLKPPLFAHRSFTTACSNARFCLELGSNA